MKNPTRLKQESGIEDYPALETMPRFIQSSFHFFKKYQNVRRQEFCQKMTVCDLLKARGNELFNSNQIEAATREYEQALSIFRYVCKRTKEPQNLISEDLEYIDIEGERPEERSLIRAIKVALYNNLAACYLKEDDYKNAKYACDEVLMLDPDQTKALYRRAKAITSDTNAGLEEYNIGFEDLRKAYTLCPQNSTIAHAFSKIKQEIARMKAGPESFRGIFNQKKEKGTNSLPNINLDVKENREDPLKSQKLTDSCTTSPSSERSNRMDSEVLQECYKYISNPNIEDQNNYIEELSRLGKILEVKRNEISTSSYSKQSLDEAKGVKIQLEKALAAFNRLKELAGLDLTNRSNSLKDAAKKYGLNINGPSLQEELKAIQAKSLDEIKLFSKINDPVYLRLKVEELSTNDRSFISDDKPSDTKSVDNSNIKSKDLTCSKQVTNKTTTNNYFINNNYFSEAESVFQEFSRLSERLNVTENLKGSKQKHELSVKDQQVLADIAKKLASHSKPGKHSNLVKVMNFIILFVAVTLLITTIILQTWFPAQGYQEI